MHIERIGGQKRKLEHIPLRIGLVFDFRDVHLLASLQNMGAKRFESVFHHHVG